VVSDHLIRGLLGTRPVRLVAAITTGVAREASERHGVVAGGQVALARGATTGLLLATLTKGKERVTVQIRGDGPVGGVIVDARDGGDVRAYLVNPAALIPGGPGERVRLVSGIGRRGVVNVVRDLGLKERVQGQCPILSGEIDADVEHYLSTSEQIESAMGCDAVLAEDGSVLVAGGVLIQCMPDDGTNKTMVAEMWRRLRLDAVYDTLAANPELTAEDLARAVLGKFDESLADELDVLDLGPVRFHCECSRERVLDTLGLLSATELQTMIDEDGAAEVTCDFCRERYQVSGEELSEILAAVGSRASS
jgi:molecular chaperone Hsp33